MKNFGPRFIGMAHDDSAGRRANRANLFHPSESKRAVGLPGCLEEAEPLRGARVLNRFGHIRIVIRSSGQELFPTI
jgi:hypothetical protein